MLGPSSDADRPQGRSIPTSGDLVRQHDQHRGSQVEVDQRRHSTAAGTPVTDAQSADARTQLEAQLPGFADLSESTAETLVRVAAPRSDASPGGSRTSPTFVTDAAEAADVYVDPRFGTFDPVAGR